MCVINAEIHNLLLGKAIWEDPDQTASTEAGSDCFNRSSLIRVCTVCLGLSGQQVLFEILEHLHVPYSSKKSSNGIPCLHRHSYYITGHDSDMNPGMIKSKKLTSDSAKTLISLGII